jgi:hypothetical protein
MNYHRFPETVTAIEVKEWVIERRGYRIRVYCNGEQLLDITASNNTCDYPLWRTCWELKVTKIEFSSSDNATKSYYIG